MRDLQTFGIKRTRNLGRRGSIAIWIAVMMPGLFFAVAMGIEAASWEAARVSAQRSADVAAMAGAINYGLTTNNQTAATFAARMAQVNGASGTASPSWNSSTNTLTDNMITAQIIRGYVTSTDTALQVTVQKNVPATLSRVFNSTSSYTVSATGVAEVVTSTSSFPGNGNGAPCMLALSSSGTITGTGSTYWTMPNCAVKSNGSVTVSGGGGPLTTDGVYAVGTVSIPTWISETGGEFSNAAATVDPFAGYTALQTALSAVQGLSGTSGISCGTTGGVVGTAGQYTGNNNCNGTNTLPNGGTCTTSSGVTCTMYPGNYSSWIVPQGGPYTFNLQPGLYLFGGPVLLTNNTTTNGTGVTIITAGGAYNGTNYSFVGSNTFNFNISAPTGAQVAAAGGNGTTNAGIAGIALASLSAYTVTLSGNEAFAVSGVVYFPNAIWDASGSSCNSSAQCMGNSSTACLELIASSIKTSGYVTFNSQCSTYGLQTQTARVTR